MANWSIVPQCGADVTNSRFKHSPRLFILTAADLIFIIMAREVIKHPTIAAVQLKVMTSGTIEISPLIMHVFFPNTGLSHCRHQKSYAAIVAIGNITFFSQKLASGPVG